MRHRLTVIANPWRARLWISAILCLMALLDPSRSALASADRVENTCDETILHNYLRPLSELPSLHQVPESGRLPFGPRDVTLNTIGDGVRVGRGVIGFSFGDKSAGVPRQLNWQTTTELFRLGAGVGHRAVLLQRKVRFVARQETAEISGQRFIVDGNPAIYKVRISIRSRLGQLLGRYGEYFRVVRPIFKAQVTVSATSIVVGEALRFRVANFGTEPILADSSFSIQRYGADGWEMIGSALTPGLRPELRATLLSGEGGRCATHRVSVDQPPGRYRIVNEIRRTEGPKHMREVALSRVFEIVDVNTKRLRPATQSRQMRQVHWKAHGPPAGKTVRIVINSADAAPSSCVPSPDAGVVRLVVAPGAVAAGRAVHFRIDNSRGPTLTYGADYSIQRCVAGVWELAPFSPTAFIRQRIAQRPSRGRWQRVPIPTTAAIGEYRVRKAVSDGMEGRWLYDDFDVSAEPVSSRRAQSREMHQVHWKSHGPPAGKTVRIVSEVGHCAGTEKPRIEEVRIREREDRVLLTAFLTVPERGIGEACAGTALGVRKVIRLRRPLGGRALYDASFSPPKLRWPQ